LDPQVFLLLQANWLLKLAKRFTFTPSPTAPNARSASVHDRCKVVYEGLSDERKQERRRPGRDGRDERCMTVASFRSSVRDASHFEAACSSQLWRAKAEERPSGARLGVLCRLNARLR
jgi:hypothetical protein